MLLKDLEWKKPGQLGGAWETTKLNIPGNRHLLIGRATAKNGFHRAGSYQVHLMPYPIDTFPSGKAMKTVSDLDGVEMQALIFHYLGGNDEAV